MAAKKDEENVLTEAVSSIKNVLRHRQKINLFGREYDRIKIPVPYIKKNKKPIPVSKKELEIYLDHKIPGLIEDTFANLGYETKDGKRPVIAAKRKTEYGWHLVINLPPGISFKQIKNHKHYFQDATNSWIELNWLGGYLQMNIQEGELPRNIRYQFNSEEYPNMELPVPVGINQRGVEVFDLVESPHILVAGVPGFGKSNFIHVLIHSLLNKAKIGIIDLKKLEFHYLREHCAVANTEEEALEMVKSLNREMEKRLNILKERNLVKIQEYNGNMPYIVLVIDEMAEIKDESVLYYIDRLVRLARAVGVSVCAATQRPSTRVINGDTRSMFQARLCYQVADELNSRMVLGEQSPQAAYLPGIKGRAIFKFGIIERQVQTYNLPLKQAKKILKGQPKGGWEDVAQKRLPPR